MKTTTFNTNPSTISNNVMTTTNRTVAPTANHRVRRITTKLLLGVFVFLVVGAQSYGKTPGKNPTPVVLPGLVISQIYGGGGNSGSTYKNDFIEIFNPTCNTISLTGWSVQYQSAGTSTWTATNLSGSIAPGKYYLIQEAQGAGGTTNLPTPDATGAIAMSASDGKVALVNSTTLIPSCADASIIDKVGFGTTSVTCNETSNAPAPSNTNSILRANGGCTDANNNSTDFTTGAPTPRNSASPAHICTTTTCPSNITKCINDPAFTLPAGTPAGGTFTSPDPGITGGNTYTPATAGAGVHTITYTTGCGSCNFTVTVLNDTWLGNNSNWFDPANWSCGVPTATTDVSIPSGTPSSPIIGAGTAQVHNLTINGSATLTNNSALNINGSGVFTNNGTYKGNGSFSGALFSNPAGGNVSPGNSPGCLSFGAGYTNLGTLNIEVNGTTPACTAYDKLNVTGTATLGGTLNVIVGYVPTNGDQVTFIAATTVSGTFATVTAPSGWSVFYNSPSAGLVTLSYAVACPGGTVTNTSTLLTYCTIQAAINDPATLNGHTLVASAASYDEQVTVNKELTIRGANSGIPGNGGRGAESILEGNNGTHSGFLIMANNVTIDGFKIKSCAGSFEAGVWTQTGTSGARIINNIITDNEIGVYPNNDALIRSNLFDANNRPGPAGGAAIYSESSSGMVIDQNEMKGHTLNSAVVLAANPTTGHAVLTFTKNYIHNNNASNSMVYCVKVTNSLFKENNITEPGTTAIKFAGACVNNVVSYNELDNNGTGFKIADDGFGFGPNSAVNAHYNHFSNNTLAGIRNDDAASTNVNVTCNWYGNISGPTIGTNVGGTGSIVVGAGPKTYANWLFYGTDASASIGVQLPAALTAVPGTNASMAINHYRILSNAVGCLVDNQTLTLSGVFNLGIPIAQSEWAKGNDQTASTTDDYTITVPSTTGVTLTAASLGSGTVRGPGDIGTVALETPLYFNDNQANSSFQNWTISNLIIRDFDVCIYSEENPGGNTTAFNNFRIINNEIDIPEDLNATLGGETPDFQNIGIHYSFGSNQEISGNTFNIMGTGTSDGTNYSKTVAIQGNTSGGTVYDGFKIRNNTFNITGNPDPSGQAVIRGIWENGANTNADIEISGNTFNNSSLSNTAGGNRQFAIWQTSFSGPTKNVVIKNNEMTGWNTGVGSLGGPYTGNTPPDYLTGQLPVLIQNNKFDKMQYGVIVRKGALSTNPGSPFMVNENSFTNSVGGGFAIKNEGSGVTSAHCNWYGSASAPVVAASVNGTAVDPIPWLVNGTDNSGAIGFQPVPGSCTGMGPVLNVNTGLTYFTIQNAIDNPATLNGHTLLASPGIYAENDTVYKSLTILGPNSAINPCTGARGAEAIVVPATNAVEFGEIFHVTAPNVTISGFTIDGDNTLLTSGVTNTTGADMNAAEGVTNYVDGVNNLTVTNNIIQNLSYFGVTMYGSGSGAPTSGSVVSNNKIQNLGTYNDPQPNPNLNINFWGGGVLVYNNQYAAVTNNCMTNVRLGVQTGNFHQANPGTVASQVISGNTIQARRRGIFHNLFNTTASVYTLSGNNITGLANANETASWDGILLSSLNDAVHIASANIINGAAITAIPTTGISVWNDQVAPLITGGTITGVGLGINVNNYEGYPSTGSDAGPTLATIDGVTVTAATISGIRVNDNSLNSSNANTVAADIKNSTITGAAGAQGITVFGPQASANIHDNAATITGGVNGVLVDSGSVVLFRNNINSNGTGVRVKRTGKITSASENFIRNNTGDAMLFESTSGISGAINNNSLSPNGGLSINNAGPAITNATCNWYGSPFGAVVATKVAGAVTFTPFLTNGTDNDSDPTNGFQPVPGSCNGCVTGVTNINTGITYCTIQGAIDAPLTLNGHTLSVAAGTYVENVNVYKEVTITGAGQASTFVIPATSNPTGGTLASVIFKIQANNITISGLTCDGKNPNITTSTDVDASAGIVTDWTFGAGDWTNMHIHDVTVRDVYRRGIFASNNVMATNTFNIHNNTVNGVQGDPSESIGIFNFGDAGSIANNTITNCSNGIFTSYSFGTNITTNNVTGVAGGIGIESFFNGNAGASVADVILTNTVAGGAYGIVVDEPWLVADVNDNTVSGSSFAGISVLESSIPAPGSANIHNNASTITGSAIGVDVDGGTATLFQNDINTNGTGVRVKNLGSLISVTENFIKSNSGDGIKVESSAGSIGAINSNDLSANGLKSINNASGPITNATCNWYGSAIASIVATKVSGPVSYSPFLVNGTDNAATDGFQPVPGSCVGCSGGVTNTTTLITYCTIQSAIDAISTVNGHTLTVDPGTYPENVRVYKELTITGAGQASTFVIPATSNPTGGTLGSVIFSVQANNVTISGLTCDGKNPGITGAGDVDASAGIVTDWTFGAGDWTNLHVHDVTIKDVYRRGIQLTNNVAATNTFNIHNNIVNGVQGDPSESIGIFNFGYAGSIANNTISNSSMGIFTSYSFGTNISTNNVTGVAGGIGIESFFNGEAGGGSVADVITNNTVTGGAYGIVVDEPWLVADVNNSTVSGSTVAGISVLESSIPAPGSANINNNASTITGSAVGVDVDGGAATLYRNNINTNGTGVRVKNSGELISVTENFIRSNTGDGIRVESGAGSIGAINDNDLSGNGLKSINNASGPIANATCNWYGSAIASVVATKVSGTVSYSPFLVNGTDNDANPTNGFQPVPGSCVGCSGGVTNTTTLITYCTIQSAIDAISTVNGHTLTVDPGTYPENVRVYKELTITGAGQASTFVIPAISNPTGSTLSSVIFKVQANNVTISGLTCDGKNVSLGAGIHASAGIVTDWTFGAGDWTNMHIHDVTVKDVYRRGIQMTNNLAATNTFNVHNNIVNGVQGDPSQSIGIFNFGYAGSIANNTISNSSMGIFTSYSFGTNISTNNVTGVAGGIGIESFFNGEAGGGSVADVITNNTVTGGAFGIVVDEPWLVADVNNSTVSGSTVAGISVLESSIPAPGSANINNNAATITGSVVGVDVDGGTATLYRNNINTNGTGVRVKNSGELISVTQNFIRSNSGDGIRVESGAGSIGAINDNDLSGNSAFSINNASAAITNATCNWYGSNVPATVATKVNGPVTYIPYLSNGNDADANPANGFQPAANCGTPIVIVSAVVDTIICGETSGGIFLTVSGGSLNYTVSWTGGVPVSGVTSTTYNITPLAAGTYTVTVTDLNGSTASVVRVVPYLPVTDITNSPNMYYATIQAAINAVTTLPGDVIQVCAGTYPENVTLNKSLTLRGAQFGVDGRGRVVGAPNPAVESIITPASGSPMELFAGSNNAVIDGFAMLGNTTSTNGVIQTLTSTLSGVQVKNNYLKVTSSNGQDFWLNRGITDLTIDKNEMVGAAGTTQDIFLNGPQSFAGFWLTNNKILGSGGTYGLFVDGNRNVNTSATPRSPLIQGNLFQGFQAGMNGGQRSLENAQVLENTFNNNSQLGFQGGPKNSNFARNTFSNNGLYGMSLSSIGGTADATKGASGTTIQNNFFFNNATSGGAFGDILLSDEFAGLQNSNTIVNNSLLSAIAIYNNEPNGGTDPIHATCNWFGSTVPATVASKIFTVAGGITLYTPWLTSGVDAAPGTPGFQPSVPCTACNLLLTPSSTNVTCPSLNDGTASVSVTGASGSYSYTWNTVPVQTTATATGLTIGSYKVVVLDANGCKDSVTIAVTAAPGVPLVHNINTNIYYCSIQTAINDPLTVNGHVLEATAGTFNELVTVNKSLTINGANANISCTGARGAESIINSTSGSGSITVTIAADNVTINGFTVKNPLGSYGISGDGVNNAFIKYNIVTDIGDAVAGTGPSYGVVMQSSAADMNGLKVTNNCINNIRGGQNGCPSATNGSAGGVAIGFGASNFNVNTALIDSNIVQNISACNFNGSGGKGAYGVLVNTGSGAGTGQNNGLIIRANEITNLAGRWSHGIGLEGETPGALVENNAVTALSSAAGDAAGVNVEDNATGAATTQIHNNSFTASTLGILNQTATNVNATCNWYGSTVPATIAAKIVGPVTYVPWLTSGVDALPGTRGFQPSVPCVVCGGGFVYNVNTSTFYCTIQSAIDAATTSNGHTLMVFAGTYAENITVSKSLTILGPNAGIGACSGPRVPEATIIPAVSNLSGAGAYGIVDITAPNVTIDGFEMNGDNPAILTGVTGTNGANIDALEAVSMYVTGIDNTVVKNNIIRNFAYFGVDLDVPSTYAGTGNIVTQNKIQDLGFYMSGHPFELWGGGVLLYDNQYAAVTNNCMTNVRIGVQTGNFNLANPGAATYQNISGNTIQARRRGIFHNLFYSSASPYTLSGNTITGLANANETAVWDGILISSMQATASTSINNNIDGSGITALPTTGISVWNDQVAPLITLDSISGVRLGINVNNYEGYPSTGSNADNTFATIDSVSVIGATVAGIQIHDNSLNSNGATVSAEIRRNTSVSGSPIGIRVSGSDATANVHDNASTITGNTVGVQVDSSGTVSQLYRNSINANGTGVRVLNGGKLSLTLENFIKNNTGDAIRVESTAGVVDNIHVNDLSGNGGLSIRNLSAPTINATCNWYGSVVPAVVATKVLGPVTYQPYLVNGTDQQPGINGFQNDSCKTIVFSDPALVDVYMTNLSNVVINANLIPLNSFNRTKLRVQNLSLTTNVPFGTTKIRIDLGNKLILDPSYNLATAPLSTYFTWTKVVEAGDDVIYGAQILDLPPLFDQTASFDVKAITPGNSRIDGDFLITNDANPTQFLIDVNLGNNSVNLNYHVLDAFVINNVSQVDVMCNGAATGSITVTVSGGASPYDFSKDGGATWPALAQSSPYTFTGLTAGNYNIAVRDAVSQVITYVSNPVIITQPSAIVTFGTHTDVLCNGGSTGTVTVNFSGGVGPYTVQFNGAGGFVSQTSPHTYSGLAAGTYTWIVKDANGCMQSGSETVGQPSALVVIPSHTDALCTGGSTGSVTLTFSGGVGPYMVNFNSGGFAPQTSPHTYSGLPAGTYTWIVKDANGCMQSGSETVGDPPVLVASSVHTNVLCNGGSTGTVTVTFSGGVGPYMVNFNSGGFAPQTSPHTYSGLAIGTYTWIVKDANGCMQNGSETITEPPVLGLTVTGTTNLTCAGNPTGSITVAATGGTPNYQFQIDGGGWLIPVPVNSSTYTFTGLAAGTHTVQVRDANGCITTASPSPVLTEPQNTDLNLGSDFSNNFFLNVGDTQTIVYNVSEIAGKSSPVTLRVFQPSGYQFIYVDTATYVSSPGPYFVNNTVWTFTQGSGYVDITRNTDLPCNTLERISLMMKRITPNKQKFNVNAVIIPAPTELILNNNSNSLLFFGN